MNTEQGRRNECMPKRYFVTQSGAVEKEVSMDEYCRAERNAGFRPKPGLIIATASFRGNNISGRVEY